MRPEKARPFCQALEKGDILFFSDLPFSLPKEHQDFLLAQKQTANAHRKNIAYKPHKDLLTNFVRADVSKQDRQMFLHIMRSFSYEVERFLGSFLSPYQSGLRLDYASFRPIEEKGRNLRRRARNDLLHMDAFSSRPVHGNRILRCYVNIHPEKPRKWITAERFGEIISLYRDAPICLSLQKRTSNQKRIFREMKRWARQLGLPLTLRSTYDEFMLRLHHLMKEDESYQKNSPKQYWSFPPGSCWIVFTDGIANATIEGRYALEQTCIISQEALIDPKSSPLAILEAFSNQSLVTSAFTRFR